MAPCQIFSATPAESITPTPVDTAPGIKSWTFARSQLTSDNTVHLSIDALVEGVRVKRSFCSSRALRDAPREHWIMSRETRQVYRRFVGMLRVGANSVCSVPDFLRIAQHRAPQHQSTELFVQVSL